MDSSESRPLHNWFLDDAHYCTFTGVTCNEFSNVIALDLPGMGLSGSLCNLKGLSELQRLFLMDNSIGGTIPSSLPPSLLDINLGFNLFTGDLSFLERISTTPNLSRLILNDNLLTGYVPPCLCHLTNLRALDVSGNMGITHTIPECFSSLQGLTTIRMRGTSVIGPIPDTLCQSQDSIMPGLCSGIGCREGYRHVSSATCKPCGRTKSNVIASYSCHWVNEWQPDPLPGTEFPSSTFSLEPTLLSSLPPSPLEASIGSPSTTPTPWPSLTENPIASFRPSAFPSRLQPSNSIIPQSFIPSHVPLPITFNPTSSSQPSMNLLLQSQAPSSSSSLSSIPSYNELNESRDDAPSIVPSILQRNVPSDWHSPDTQNQPSNHASNAFPAQTDLPTLISTNTVPSLHPTSFRLIDESPSPSSYPSIIHDESTVLSTHNAPGLADGPTTNSLLPAERQAQHSRKIFSMYMAIGSVFLVLLLGMCWIGKAYHCHRKRFLESHSGQRNGDVNLAQQIDSIIFKEEGQSLCASPVCDSYPQEESDDDAVWGAKSRKFLAQQENGRTQRKVRFSLATGSCGSEDDDETKAIECKHIDDMDLEYGIMEEDEFSIPTFTEELLFEHDCACQNDKTFETWLEFLEQHPWAGTSTLIGMGDPVTRKRGSDDQQKLSKTSGDPKPSLNLSRISSASAAASGSMSRKSQPGSHRMLHSVYSFESAYDSPSDYDYDIIDFEATSTPTQVYARSLSRPILGIQRLADISNVEEAIEVLETKLRSQSFNARGIGSIEE